jgi:hypothetical protein
VGVDGVTHLRSLPEPVLERVGVDPLDDECDAVVASQINKGFGDVVERLVVPGRRASLDLAPIVFEVAGGGQSAHAHATLLAASGKAEKILQLPRVDPLEFSARKRLPLELRDEHPSALSAPVEVADGQVVRSKEPYSKPQREGAPRLVPVPSNMIEYVQKFFARFEQR